MTAWAVSITDTFLNEMVTLPQKVSKKVTKAVKVLEHDPISAQGDAKKLKGYTPNIYRIRIGNYRVFYSFGEGWVKLLSVRKRDERTYETEIPNFETPPPPPKALDNWELSEVPQPQTPAPPTPEKEPETVPPSQDTTYTTALPFQLTPDLLKKWRIPQEYWQDLLNIPNSEALLELPLSDQLLNRILDNLYPRPLNEIDSQPEYRLQQPEDLDRYFEGDISAFLLKLSPEQEKLRDFGKQGPILVKGGPGSGKSTLALYRVKKLLDLGYTSILFTTYTNALVTYSEQLLEQLLGQPPKEAGVEVTTVDSLTYHYYVKTYGRTGFAKEEQCLTHLKTALATTEIPAKNVFDRQVRQQTLEKLGLSYLLQEFLEVIESRGIETLTDYCNISRTGRGVPLKANIREAIWAVYQTWSDIMARKGLKTWEKMRCEALKIVTQKAADSFPYDAVIIDEAQDLSPVALRFLLALVPDLTGVYLTADASQSLYQKGFSWKQIHADLKVAGRTLLLKRNYRNTQQISDACAVILANTEAGDQDCLHQQPSPYQGDSPKILLVEEEDQEIKAIRDFFLKAAKKYRLPLHGGAILCPRSQTAKKYAKKLDALGLKAKYVSGKKIDIKAPYIKVLTLHAAKGLEFPFVVVGLTHNDFPKRDSTLPDAEVATVVNAQRRLFYVGCSRAMRALMVCDSPTQSSSFLEGLQGLYWES
ncbi:3'-5' exonuclease [Spirulina sp. CS-785/01]|uniref:3'-5' exonuclease n=1 Tax=Spirulina sp. CS-785/01 TaxID=3021716 RepID=UPI00232D7523|nr:3'-5' exonuclease [Spirulina sp. CS-785/01]MDB9311920.1 3'-5' exonuclease [Spirulina sp. CS-785/01]